MSRERCPYPGTHEAQASESLSRIEQMRLIARRARHNHAMRTRRFPQLMGQAALKGRVEHTPDELQAAATEAWREAAECPGRQMYKSLKVLDARDAKAPGEVFEAAREHLKLAFNDTGRSILSVATVLDKSVHIYNPQLLQYAGYEQNGAQIGYRRNNQLTQLALDLGWQPPQDKPAQFDLLPLIVSVGDQRPQWFTIPEEHEGKQVFQRIKLQHPTHGWLGGESEADALEWYSTPALANWGLAVDGQQYKLPFSGHYAVEEIIPDLTMPERMDVSPLLARQVFGVEHENQLPRSLKSTWKSEVRAVINTAVQYSFDKAGVRIIDTQRMSGQFCEFMDRYEAEQGELPPVNYAYVRDGFDVWGSDIYHRFTHPIDVPPKTYMATLVRPT